MVPNGDGTAAAVTACAPLAGLLSPATASTTHGGTVLKANPVPIYIIWYGNWNGTGFRYSQPRRP